MVLFYGWGSTAPRLQSYYEEAVYILPLCSQKQINYHESMSFLQNLLNFFFTKYLKQVNDDLSI